MARINHPHSTCLGYAAQFVGHLIINGHVVTYTVYPTIVPSDCCCDVAPEEAVSNTANPRFDTFPQDLMLTMPSCKPFDIVSLPRSMLRV